jgi:AAA domain, putative AbiEii toxin, Type IV TA system/AAA ATPase domain
MITKLTLRNFKSVGEQVYDFTRFDLLVGRNNSGKSTVLQAMAIWQFCVDEFHRSKRTGTTGIQVVLPNFTALPVPEFILLWKDRTDRRYPKDAANKKKQEFVLIEILLEWQDAAGKTGAFGVELRYHSPQTIYAIPSGGWSAFRECEKTGSLPRIAYVPPFSGLEPTEKFLDISPMRQQVGKGQPGSVLRNLLLRVSSPTARDNADHAPIRAPSAADWKELASIVDRWFSVKISPPRYESTKDVYITVEYADGARSYDIISGGSGFHQTLTLLAFLFGYQPTTILLDEPDAHLHVNLQREILDYFKRKSQQLGTQFLIATHAEEFARGVDASQIVSLLNRKPKRVESTPAVLQAMADVSNEEITRVLASPYILYVEGESDERILRAWAGACGAQDAMDEVCFKTMGGGGKKNMKERADAHFVALQQIVPGVTRLMLFDFDDADEAFHPNASNPVLAEWKRKNIENYLLVPDAWRRAALQQLQLAADDLFAQSTIKIIDAFFADQNLTLPPGRTWRQVNANIFSVVNGKKILFESADGLFQQLRSADPPVTLIREAVALSMTPDEIHKDVHEFIGKVIALTTKS